jgi:hypothetical protein
VSSPRKWQNQTLHDAPETRQSFIRTELCHSENCQRRNQTDAVIVEHPPTRYGRFIAKAAEVFAVIYVIGLAAGPVAELAWHIGGGKHLSVSMTTLVGATGALLMWVVNSLVRNIDQTVLAHVHIADALAPFFGNRLDNALRILKSPTRAS